MCALSTCVTPHTHTHRPALPHRSVDALDALRLLMLYTLRYERSRADKVAELRRFMCDNVDGVRESVGLVDTLLSYGGASVRGSDLFGTGTMLSKLSSQVRQMQGGEITRAAGLCAGQLRAAASAAARYPAHHEELWRPTRPPHTAPHHCRSAAASTAWRTSSPSTSRTSCRC